MATARARAWGVNALCVLAAVLVFCIMAELALRLLGFQPFHYMQSAPSLNTGQQRMYQPDAVTGYMVKPGRYEFDYLPDGKYRINVTIGPSGSRAPDAGTLPGKPYLYFVGCSICFGIGVDDSEVFSHILSETTGYGTENQCVGGYGTAQSLERLRRAAARWSDTRKPAAIVYAMIPHHASRNVVSSDWIIGLDAANRRENGLKLPYARLDANGKVKVHPPAIYAAWPLREHSALVYTLEQSWVKATWGGGSEAEAREVTIQLVEDMKRISDAHGVPFYVVFLGAVEADFAFYSEKFGAFGAQTVQCNDDRANHKEFQVPNDGHPNGTLHASYAKCIAEHIVMKLPSPRANAMVSNAIKGE